MTIITLMGAPCSGKSTVAKRLAEHYGYKHYSMGDMRRKIAVERGISLAELNRLAEGVEDSDSAVDAFQKKLGQESDDFVVDGRVSAFMIPHAIKIYLDADEAVRADRMVQDDWHHRMGENITDHDRAVAVMRERVESDKRRYKRHYDYDPYHPENYDIIIDTSKMDINQVTVELIRQIDVLRQ